MLFIDLYNMTEISFVSSSENDSYLKSELNIISAQEKDCDIVKSEDDYEFNESDSHITDLVKDYCDNEENLSDTEHANKFSSEFRMDPIPKRSYSSLSMLRNNSKNKFKISSIFKEDLEQSIARFKVDLFNRVTGNQSSELCSIYYFKSRSFNNNIEKQSQKTSKFFPEDTKDKLKISSNNKKGTEEVKENNNANNKVSPEFSNKRKSKFNVA